VQSENRNATRRKRPDSYDLDKLLKPRRALATLSTTIEQRLTVSAKIFSVRL
jgi:hypothetical protein